MSVLIAGTGAWSNALDDILRTCGIRSLHATNLAEVVVCARHVRPAFTVLGPALTKQEIVRAFVDLRTADPSCYVVVAVERDDREFARDLLAIGVPAMALIPVGLHGIAQEAKRVLETVGEPIAAVSA